MRILAFMDWYLPGYKAGGPVRTVSNMVEQFAGELEFSIVTRDRDFGDAGPYPGVRPDQWTPVSRARVFYLPPGRPWPLVLARICHSTPHDLIYLSSLFSRLTIGYFVARLLGWVPRKPIVLAPRGEFAPGALRIRSRRKRAYLAIASRTRLMDGVVWQASAAHERDDIERELSSRGMLGRSRGVLIAPDLLPRYSPRRANRSNKEQGRARFLFLSRISAMKNLHMAIRLMGALDGDVSLDVYGPIEDHVYWRECERVIGTVGSRAKIRYLGAVKPDEVPRVMAQHDFLLLPTQGENFGHVIAEALAVGTPVITSDRTSWNHIQSRGAGWCIPLDDVLWSSRLQACVEMDSATHAAMSQAASEIAIEAAARSDAIELNRRLFHFAAATLSES